MQREDWDGALSELQHVLSVDANNPALHNQIGDVYLRKDEVGQACDHFELAVDLYSTLGLQNNAVALCRKVVRLAPTRVEVRYNLARLRMDQGLRSDATVAFVDYLEHVQPSDDAGADAFEKRCVNIVEEFPEIAPAGQILEKLEAVNRPAGAYKIVQRLAQRAADSGDAAAASRLTEKMRSLRVLLENNPDVDLDDGVDQKQTSAGVDPTTIDLDVAAPEIEAVAPEVDLTDLSEAPEAVAPEIDLTAALDVGAVEIPTAPPDKVGEDGIPEVDLDGVGSLDAAVADFNEVLKEDVQPVVEEETVVDVHSPPSAASKQPVPEYELPETSLEEVANLLAQEGVAPAPAQDADSAVPELLQPEDAEQSIFEEATTPGASQEVSMVDTASIADTFADPREETSSEKATDSGVPPLDPDDQPASVVYEPSVSPRVLPSSSDNPMRREPVWIPSPDTQSADPTPEEEGQIQELEEVIDTFREQMSRALGDDGPARYDLGVAYYEMGLYNEALAEFEVSVKCPDLADRTLEMMASCLAQEGRHSEIVSLLEEPLGNTADASPDRLALQYAMGLALEATGKKEDARRHFEEVALVDIGFKDIQSRLQR